MPEVEHTHTHRHDDNDDGVRKKVWINTKTEKGFSVTAGLVQDTVKCKRLLLLVIINLFLLACVSAR